MEMQDRNAGWKCRMEMQDGNAGWKCRMEMQDGNTGWRKYRMKPDGYSTKFSSNYKYFSCREGQYCS
jgi:hypothetical protein